MEIQNLKYIVFLLNSETQQYLSDGRRIDTHSGSVFSNLQTAKEYAREAIKENLCKRFVIGVFVYDNQAEQINIDLIETFGFKNDKKKINQLQLFN